jgi:LuxR family maltose regulon positive regulatory protein
VLNREDRVTCERWLRLLPEDFIRRQPWLLLARAVTLQWAWQLGAEWKTLDQIEVLLDEGGKEGPPDTGVPNDLPLLRGMLAALRAQQASAYNQPDRAVAWGAEALALLPEQWRLFRGGAILYWAMGMRSLGQGEAAQRTLTYEYESSHGKRDVYVQFVLFAACFNAIESGNLEQAGRFGQVMLDATTAAGMPLTSGHAHYVLGWLRYSRNELDAAEQHFQELVAGRFAMHAQTARNGMIGLTRVHVARADVAAASSVLELLEQFDLARLGQDAEDTRSLRAHLRYLQRDCEWAFRWADGFTAPAVARSLLWLQNPHLTKAELLLARGADEDVRSALDILDVLLESAERAFSVRSQIEVLPLRALALDRQGKTADGLAALQRAVELARPGGFVRVFVDLGSPMRTMLLRLAGRGFAVENIRRIVTAFSESPKQSETSYPGSGIRAANAALIEPLTDRELEVLALLRERLSNKEIAQMLGVSTATVKRHTVNLYGKLSVSSRRDAVVKAEDLRLLPPH